jgi:DNA-binding NarL/FixJ family response regulator
MKVLIVEDSEGLAKVLQALVASAGHEVVGTLADGNGVEEALARLKPDIVCLDYQLPGRDGLTLLAAIQAVAPATDVVFMTACEDFGIEQKAADAGAAGFVRKPFNQAQLIKLLNEVAELRQVAAKARAAGDDGPEEPIDFAGGSVGGRRTAVIADDCASVRMVLKGLLDECGVRVVQSVGNGAEALSAAKKHRPGLLCLDVNMPVMNGLDALPQIRAVSPETAVVMITGSADRAFVAHAAAHGAKGYILKPLRPAYVIGFMNKLLAA